MAEEDPDDPQLKALRAVWLAMRDSDEDPPDSGVSALMAAARSQASLMTAKPPWWKRLFEQLRRPPVLALASLLVLIGGAVLITKHDDLEKAPTTAPVRQKELPARNLDVGGGVPATLTPEAEHKPEPDGKTKPKDETPSPPPVRPRPTAPAHTSAGQGMGAPRTNEPAFETGAAAGDMTVAPEAQKRPTAKADSELPPTRVLVDQLAAQARRAADRGDCENARAIATRIAGQDAGYYRDHVAGDLAKCVPAPAAAAH